MRRENSSEMQQVLAKIPKIITVSGQSHDECEKIINEAQEKRNDVEFIDNIQSIYKHHIIGHTFRGYTILGDPKTTEIKICLQKRPIWFLLTGYGGFWPEMGKDFMKMESFQKSIVKISKVLKTEGINLPDMALHSSEVAFDDMTNSVMFIVANQIALVDLYASLGIEPVGIIGTSVGEMAAAYADRSLTLEQSILSAYLRRKTLHENVLVPTTVSRVLLTRKAAKPSTSDIFIVGSFNGVSVYLAEISNSIITFARELYDKYITAKLSKYPLSYYSKYLTKAGTELKNKFERFIPIPRIWFSKWLPASKSDTSREKLSNVGNFAYIIVNSVNFYEVVQHIPGNAVTLQLDLEHSEVRKQMMAKIIKSNTPGHIGAHENVTDFLVNVGKLYTAGAQPDVSKLYSAVAIPTSNGNVGNHILNSVRRYHTARLEFSSKIGMVSHNDLNYDGSFSPRLGQGAFSMAKTFLKFVSSRK